MNGIRTPLCDLLGIEWPVVQAPIGSWPALAAAVSNAGGLGMLALGWLDEDDSRELTRETQALTDRPIAANFVLTSVQHRNIAVALGEGIRGITLFWSEPQEVRPYVEQVHAEGAIVALTVGSAAQARGATAVGVDVVVAQGLDAGGHVWGRVGTLSLVPAAVDAVDPTPVIAAGGIADGRGLAACLALGAQAVWIGTRFLAAEETAIHPLYRERLLACEGHDTVHNPIFDGGWPHAWVRTIRNSTWERWHDAGEPPAGRRPGEGETVATYPDGSPVPRYAISYPDADVTGGAEAMALYAGQGVGLVRRVQPASEIVREIVGDAEGILTQQGRAGR